MSETLESAEQEIAALQMQIHDLDRQRKMAETPEQEAAQARLSEEISKLWDKIIVLQGIKGSPEDTGFRDDALGGTRLEQ